MTLFSISATLESIVILNMWNLFNLSRKDPTRRVICLRPVAQLRASPKKPFSWRVTTLVDVAHFAWDKVEALETREVP